MSKSFKKDYKLKTYKENSNNSKLFDEKLILYTKKDINHDFFEIMKSGYLEMGDINLQLAIDSEIEMFDFNNYEAWLCGE